MAKSTLSEADQELIVQLHNQFRSEVGLADSPLTWDDGLADGAQAYANQVGDKAFEDWQHSSVGLGENLALAPDAKYAVEEFYDERINYHGEAIQGDNYKSWGHYTQMIWKDTKRVGAGAFSRKDGLKTFVFRYDPGGNVGGESAPFLSRVVAGPAGVAATTFDDTEKATALENAGKLLSKLVLRWGDVIASIQAFHGEDKLDLHGGLGIPANTGTISEVPIDPTDPIVEVSGYHGMWFGADYILQLSFRTKQYTIYGPFGTMAYAETKNAFYLPVPAGYWVRAIFGSTTPANNNTSECLGQLGLALTEAKVLPPTKGISITAGNRQMVSVKPPTGMIFPYPLAVRVTDDKLNPVAQATVTFTALGDNASVVRQGGRVTQSAQSTTDAKGIATDVSAVANNAGDIKIEAKVDSGPEPRSVTFTLTAKAG